MRREAALKMARSLAVSAQEKGNTIDGDTPRTEDEGSWGEEGNVMLA